MAVVSFPDVDELMQLEAASMVGDGVWTILQATYPTANDIKRLFKTLFVAPTVSDAAAQRVAEKILAAHEGPVDAEDETLEIENISADCHVLASLLRTYFVEETKRSGPGEKTQTTQEAEMVKDVGRLEKALLGKVPVDLRCPVKLYPIIEKAIKHGTLLVPGALVPQTKLVYAAGTGDKIEFGADGAIIHTDDTTQTPENCRVSADTLTNQMIIWLQAVATGAEVMPPSRNNPEANTRHDGFGVSEIDGETVILGCTMADYVWWMGLNVRVTGVLSCSQYVAWLRTVYAGVASYLQNGYNWATAFRYATRDCPWRQFKGSVVESGQGSATVADRKTDQGELTADQLTKENSRLQRQVSDLKAAGRKRKENLKRKRFESVGDAAQRELANALKNPAGAGARASGQQPNQQQQSRS